MALQNRVLVFAKFSLLKKLPDCSKQAVHIKIHTDKQIWGGMRVILKKNKFFFVSFSFEIAIEILL